MTNESLALADRHYAAGNLAKAIPIYVEAIAADPQSVHAMLRLANIALQQSRDGIARDYLEKVIAIDADHFEARRALARVHFEFGEHQKQLQQLATIQGWELSSGQLMSLAETLRRMRMEREAATVYRQLLELEPDNGHIYARLALLKLDMGERQSGERYSRELLAINPDAIDAHVVLANLNALNDTDFERMQNLQALPQGQLSALEQMRLGFAMGTAYDDRSDFEQALTQYQRAQSFAEQIQPYSETQSEAVFSGITKRFDYEFLLRNCITGSQSARPVFVVGMPGSGIDLLETLLCAHPKIKSAGEMGDFQALARRIHAIKGQPFYQCLDGDDGQLYKVMASRYLAKISAICGSGGKVLDTMPFNYLYLGLINQVFPRARILHCRRDSADTCITAFKTPAVHYEPVPHDMAAMARYYARYESLMQHWHDVLPFKIYDVDFDELTANPEEEISAILNFCQLTEEGNLASTLRLLLTADDPPPSRVRWPTRHSLSSQTAQYGDKLEC